jgi:hypothetical protein
MYRHGAARLMYTSIHSFYPPSLQTTAASSVTTRLIIQFNPNFFFFPFPTSDTPPVRARSSTHSPHPRTTPSCPSRTPRTPGAVISEAYRFNFVVSNPKCLEYLNMRIITSRNRLEVRPLLKIALMDKVLLSQVCDDDTERSIGKYD